MDPRHHIIIIGGGLAGLTATRHLLRSVASPLLKLTLVEAQERLGGRVCANTDFVPGYPLDIGAEFIHCVDTILTDDIEKTYKLAPREKWEPYFVTAHADGGPDQEPTRDGKYGMYYVDGELLMYNDPKLKPLSQALERMMNRTGDRWRSVADALQDFPLEPALQRLAVAGYGNTAGSTDMSRLSLSMLAQFETYWDENETDGDFRLPAHLGMTAVVRALADEVKQDDRLTVKLAWPVETITITTNTDSKQVAIRGRDQSLIQADAVICTVPPPLLPGIMPTLLTEAQLETLQHIGFETVLKIILKFKERPWPDHLQSVIWADGGPLPETWFRNDFVVVTDGEESRCHLMVGYMASDAADAFLVQMQRLAKQSGRSIEEEATKVCLKQLSQISMPVPDLERLHVATLLHAWNAETEPFTPGGYMYPKVGLETLAPLCEPCRGGRVFLAGEATNSGAACCTLQAAMESGLRAANQVRDVLKDILY